VLTFSRVTGSVTLWCCGDNGPDGGPFYSSTNLLSWNGVSGAIHSAKTMFLAGVFLDGTEPVDPAPARLDFSLGGLGENFVSLSPQLNQTFFIGDGLTGTGTGTLQQFLVPTTATRLFLGFLDAFDGTISGLPGYYGDNSGSLTVDLAITSNAAPMVTALTLPLAPIALGQPVAVQGSFTDQNLLDVHTASIDWDDGSPGTVGTVSESSGNGSFSGQKTYSVPGVFTITVTVSDGFLSGSRSSVTEVPSYLVVYDAASGFVTGGGWFDSPKGACLWMACASDVETTGRATFGFVSRYNQGATTPTGNTEFQFKAGHLNFSSTKYQWLVVAGSRAQFKGEGTINGAGTYGFLVTAIDGALPGSGGLDRFRIKLWEKSSGTVVYDNQLGHSEDSPAATVVSGGSIVIHN
jgi:hypothetical protein